MTRSHYFIGGLVALSLVFVAQSFVLVPAPRSGAAAQAKSAPAAAPTAPQMPPPSPSTTWPPGPRRPGIDAPVGGLPTPDGHEHPQMAAYSSPASTTHGPLTAVLRPLGSASSSAP